MLDIKFIRENPELVQKGADAKNFKVDVKALLALDAEIRPLQTKTEDLLARRNQISREIPKSSKDEQERLKAEVAGIKGQLESMQEELKRKKEELHNLLLVFPQPAGDDVPHGKDDSDNVEVKRWGTPTKFDFEPKDHVTLGEKLGIIDIERGVRIAGSRSYIFKGDGALLEQAILRFGYDLLVKRGYTPVSVPVLVNEAAMEGTGYFPLGRDQAYLAERDHMALIGTSEVSLCAMHKDDLLNLTDLPIRYMAQTPCFRREAGTYGKDTKGLYRVHQFNKIEMVIIAPNDKDLSAKLHDELLDNAETLLQSLGLSYRAVYVCTGDLGQGQVRKHDLEAWMPSRNAYGETHSCSTFYDFQARRLNLRYRDAQNEKHVAYTLNNTLCATPRLMLAIIENYQTADGRVRIPSCLQPYMGGRELI